MTSKGGEVIDFSCFDKCDRLFDSDCFENWMKIGENDFSAVRAEPNWLRKTVMYLWSKQFLSQSSTLPIPKLNGRQSVQLSGPSPVESVPSQGSVDKQPLYFSD